MLRGEETREKWTVDANILKHHKYASDQIQVLPSKKDRVVGDMNPSKN